MNSSLLTDLFTDTSFLGIPVLSWLFALCVATLSFVVLRAGHVASDAMVMELQDFVKSQVAPYKYPRAVQFVDQLPRTATGKLQRFRLHQT